MLQREKILNSLGIQLNDEKNQLEAILLPYEEAIIKTTNYLNRVNNNDMTEVKNTWDSFNLGKFIITKIRQNSLLYDITSADFNNLIDNGDILLII